MIVWVLETGLHSDRGIAGIFSSAEKAMAAWPIREDMHRFRESRNPSRVLPLEWVGGEGGWMLSGADHDDAAIVTPYVIDGDA